MIQWFTEEALVPTLLGGFLAFGFFFLFFYSGEKVMLLIALIVSAVTASIAIIERNIVTDREKAVTMIYDAGRAATRNDFEFLFGLIRSDLTDQEQRARQILRNVEFENVRIVGIKEYEPVEGATPARAVIRFVVFGSGRKGANAGPFNREVKLTLEMVNDQWKIVDFDQYDPRSSLSP